MLTQEQEIIIDTVLSDTNKIIAVNAIAGSGKTSTGEAIIKAYKPKNGFYTAYNKAIITDSNDRFGNLINCKTMHALAYSYIKPKRNITNMSYDSIKEYIPYETKAEIIDTLDNFFISNSTNVYDYVSTISDETVQELVVKYAEDMLKGKVNPTFNYLLKCLHLMLVNKDVEIDLDLFICDECQDVIPVTLEIFKLINADRKVILGDKFQNIYSFINTINAFTELNDLIILPLSKSFRCNIDIANTVDKYGKKFLDEKFKFEGNENITKTSNTQAFICRYNSTLIERACALINANMSFSLIRDVNEIFALPMALLNASNGRSVYDKRYKFLEKEYKNYLKEFKEQKNFLNYVCNVTQDQSLIRTCRMLENFRKKKINIYEVKKAIDKQKVKANTNIIISTAHAFKGLEADTVYIEQDLNDSIDDIIFKIKSKPIFSLEEKRSVLSPQEIENLNTYYVALTRAKTTLNNAIYMR